MKYDTEIQSEQMLCSIQGSHRLATWKKSPHYLWRTIKWNTVKQAITVFTFFPLRNVCSNHLAICKIGLFVFTFELYNLFIHSGHNFFVRYLFCECFLSICGLPAHFTVCFDELVYFYISCYPHTWFKLDTIYWIKELKVVPPSFPSFLYLATFTDYLLCGSPSSILLRIQ